MLVLAGCGSSVTEHRAKTVASRQPTTTSAAPVPRARPHVVQPVAGQASPGTTASNSAALTSTSAAPAASSSPNPSLSQPASVSRAAARGAPTDAEIRREVARFQLAIARYHLDRLDLSSALLDPSRLPPGQYNTSVASVFTDYGLPIACGGVLRVSQLGVANKTLPCGTEVVFRYGGRAIRVPVIDRGPYIAGRDWDLTGAAAEALHFPGLGFIAWRIG